MLNGGVVENWYRVVKMVCRLGSFGMVRNGEVVPKGVDDDNNCPLEGLGMPASFVRKPGGIRGRKFNRENRAIRFVVED